jgi:hypothetical protein
MKHFEGENYKYSLLKSSHNTFFLAARSFAFLVALQLSLRESKKRRCSWKRPRQDIVSLQLSPVGVAPFGCII